MFDNAVPNAIDVREILVHFDEYERGSGNLQNLRKESGKKPPRLNVFTRNEAPTYWLYLLDDGLRLDIGIALDAADELVNRVLNVLSD